MPWQLGGNVSVFINKIWRAKAPLYENLAFLTVKTFSESLLIRNRAMGEGGYRIILPEF